VEVLIVNKTMKGCTVTVFSASLWPRSVAVGARFRVFPPLCRQLVTGPTQPVLALGNASQSEKQNILVVPLPPACVACTNADRNRSQPLMRT
jgi:hypothetical protein